MGNWNSYEDLSVRGAQLRATNPHILEAYSGSAIVGWYGNIERQIDNMIAHNEASRNFVYADKLREFLRIWRENEITGSLNREDLMALKAAAEILAVDSWDLKSYFSALRDQVRRLIASEEELPRVDGEDDGGMGGMPGGGSGGGGMPPMSPEFGGEEDAGDMPPETEGAIDAGGDEGEEDISVEDVEP